MRTGTFFKIDDNLYEDEYVELAINICKLFALMRTSGSPENTYGKKMLLSIDNRSPEEHKNKRLADMQMLALALSRLDPENVTVVRHNGNETKSDSDDENSD